MSPNSGLNSNSRIEYDRKTSRFVIAVPPWLVDKVRAVPNRRWDPRRRVWTAPALRANSEFLLSNFDSTVFSVEARQVAIETVERSRSATLAQFPQTYAFKTQPRQYQLSALSSAWGKSTFAFYMDMGTGKTKTALDLFSAYYIDAKVDRLLVVTKFSTRRNWEREVGIHMPVEADVCILDTGKPKAFNEWNVSAGAFKILIVGTESLAAGSAMQFASKFVAVSTRVGMIVDEAHMIKNHSAVRSKNCVKLGNSAAYKVIMTGTPVANGPMDVFMQFEFLDPNIIGIGDFYSFRNRYAIMGGFEQRQVVGYQNLSELIELISPFVYQVRKSEVLSELPPKVYETREISMTDEQKRLYRELAKKNKAVTGDRGIMVKTVLERMLRLQEVTGGVITYERNPDLFNREKFEHCRIAGKNPKVEEVLTIAEENPVSTIIWCRFLEEITMVAAALRDKYGADSVVEIHGGVGEADRDHNVHGLFQSGKARFLVGNAATGGVGLNMTQAELVIYFSNSFSFTDREQSEDRAHRIGQTRSVTYIDLIAEGTVDVAVVQALREKKDVSEFVRGSINEANESTLFGTLA